MVNLFFQKQRPTCWCLKFGSFVSCCNINEMSAQNNFSWAAELEQFSDELQMVKSMFSLFCLFLSHMVTSHWCGDSCWLTATVVLEQWGSGLCTPWGDSSSCCSENNCAWGKRSVFGSMTHMGRQKGFVLCCYNQTFIQLCHGAPNIRRVTCCREYSHIQFIEWL